jgi:hypothetical protein
VFADMAETTGEPVISAVYCGGRARPGGAGVVMNAIQFETKRIGWIINPKQVPVILDDEIRVNDRTTGTRRTAAFAVCPEGGGERRSAGNGPGHLHS